MDFSSQFTVVPLPFPNLSNNNDDQADSPTCCYLIKLSNRINILCDCPIDLKQAYSINVEMDESSLVPSQHNMITDWSYGPQTIDLNAHVTKPKDSAYSLFPWIILPEWDLVDFGTLDYILISNHHLITALPYITEYTNFKGQILATSPIKHFARWLLFDLVDNIPLHAVNPEKLNEFGIDYSKNFSHIHAPFTTSDIEECLSKVSWVTFNQRVPMSSHDSEDYFEAFSSGFQIGATNWLINTANAKIGYISTSASISSFQSEFVSCDIDKSLFQRCNQLLISNLHFSLPYLNSKKFDELSYDKNYDELEKVIDELSLQMANIIFPVEMDGTLFNLLSIIYEWSKKRNRLNKTKIFFISKNAHQWAQLTHKCFEWVNQKNQNQYLFHATSTPSAVIPPISTIVLEFSQWVLSNLHFYEDVTTEAIQLLHTNPNFQYIAFCDHPSFKSGRCYQLIKSMALYSPSNRPHSVIFTDGRFDALYYKDAKFNMGSLRSYFLPLDPSFDAGLISSLIDHLPSPPQILIEENNARLMKDFSLKSSLSANIKYLSASLPNIITIDLSHTMALAEPSLLSSLSGKWLYHRQLMASFQGLCNLENRHQLHLTTFSSLSKFNTNITFESSPIWATLSLSDLIETLNQMEYGSINRESFSILPSPSASGQINNYNGISNHSNSEENGTSEYLMDDLYNESYRLTFSGMTSSIHRKDPCILIECQKHTQLIQSIKLISSNRQISNEIFDHIQKVTINFNQHV